MKSNFRNLILWRDVRITGPVFAVGIVLLLAFSFYSVLEVVTCISIPFIAITLSIRILSYAKCGLLKQPCDNPFQYWLDEKLEIGGDKMDSINRKIANLANTIVVEMKRIALVDDIADTVKGLFLVYVWYYIGRNISGLSLLFLGFIGMFSIPKIYDMYRREIDNIMRQIRMKYDDLSKRITASIPGLSGQTRSSKHQMNGVHKKEEEKVESVPVEEKEVKQD